MYHIIVYGFQNRIHQCLTQLFTFAVNIHITTTAEVDAFERASFLFFRFIDLCQTHLAFLVHQNSLSRKQFIDTIGRHIQRSLYNRTFGCQYHNFIVHVPESRTNTPRITHSKTLTATRQSTNHVAAIPFRTGSFQNVRQIDTVFDGMCNIHAFQSFRLTFVVKTFHLTVQTMTNLFQHNICIGIFTRMLSGSSDISKNLIYIRQIKVSAQGQILGTPVITAQERMHIRNTTLARSRITQVSHIQFTGKRQAFLRIISIMELFGSKIFKITVHRSEYLGNGTSSQSSLSKHIFFTRICLKLHTSQSRSFLSAVMLFFHQQIQLVKPVHPRAILFLIIFKWFQQANHRYSTFML